MANFAHYTRGSCTSITQHNERKKNDKGEYLKYKNGQIDTSRTHLNYNLAPDRAQTQLEFISERTESLKCLKRKDVNVMASWLITAPKTLPKEYQKEFFERSYQFLEEKYGKQNIISAYVHMDETTPHMHFCFVPVVFDRKKQKEKVSCKECVTKYDLQKFHPDFQKYIDEWKEQKSYEFECSVLNGATSNGNMTIEELKANTLAEMNANEQSILSELIERSNEECALLENIKGEIENLSEMRQKLSDAISDLEGYKSTLENKINTLEGKFEQNNRLLAKQQKQIEDKNTLLKALDASVEPLKDHSAIISTQKVLKGLKTENKTVVEGMSVEQVQNIFKMVDLSTKASDVLLIATKKAKKILSKAVEDKKIIENDIANLQDKKKYIAYHMADIQLERIKKDMPERFTLGGNYISNDDLLRQKNRSFEHENKIDR